VDELGRANRRGLCAGLTIALLALTGVTCILPVFRDALQSYLGISLTRYGLLLSVGMISGIVGALAGGRLVDRLGAGVMVRVSLVGAAAGMVAVSVARGWLFLLLALSVVGLFVAALRVGVGAYLVALFPGQRRRILSLNMVATSAVGVAFPLVAEGLLGLERTRPSVTFADVLHAPFLVVAVVLVGGVLLFGRAALPGAPTRADEPGGWSRGPHAALLIGLMVTHGACDTALAAWMPRVLGGTSFARMTFAPGVVMAAFSLSYVVSRSLLAALPERWGARWMVIAPGLIGGAAFLTGLLGRTQAAAAIGYVVGGFCWSFEYPALLAMLAGRGGRRFGTAFGTLMVAGGLAAFGLTNLLGLIADGLPESSMWMILLLPAAGFPLVGVGGAVWIRLGGHAPVATETPQDGS